MNLDHYLTLYMYDLYVYREFKEKSSSNVVVRCKAVE